MSDDTENPPQVRRAGLNNNLILPEKGEIRNPKGKPKGTRNRSTIVREALEAACNPHLLNLMKINGMIPADADVAQYKSVADQLTAAIVASAASGDVKSFTALMDSAFGKLTENIVNTHNVNRMGDVMIQPPAPAEGSSVPEPKALSFDIGEDAINVIEEEDTDENASGSSSNSDKHDDIG